MHTFEASVHLTFSTSMQKGANAADGIVLTVGLERSPTASAPVLARDANLLA